MKKLQYQYQSSYTYKTRVNIYQLNSIRIKSFNKIFVTQMGSISSKSYPSLENPQVIIQNDNQKVCSQQMSSIVFDMNNLQVYKDKVITSIQKYQSSISNSVINIYTLILQLIPASPSRNLKHWELIVSFGSSEFRCWRINFGKNGLEMQIAIQKQELVYKRNQNIKTEDIQFRNGLVVDDILKIIKQVQSKKYKLGEWNCQNFTTNIIEKIK